MFGVTDIGRNLIGLSSHHDKLRKNEFWAVDNISFEVKKGETLGIIGPNGSGKTTMLKMINGIFWPDKGKITVKGKVGALIAVGAGFHPQLSGRENIYINGAILGMSRKEISKKFDDIVDFADIGDFLDTPVKHYSSGMFVRLGFAIAVHSLSLPLPTFSFELLTFASLVRILNPSSSCDISREKKTVGILPLMDAFCATFIAKLVLPIPGLPAIIVSVPG